MSHLDEVMKEYEKVLTEDFHISNDEMQQENIRYRRQILIAKIKYHLRKIINFLFPSS